MTSEVSDMIRALRDGTMSLERGGAAISGAQWPRRRRPPAASYLEMAARAQEDPEPYVPGSFDDVAAAYHRGELTRRSTEFCPRRWQSRNALRIERGEAEGRVDATRLGTPT